MKKKRFSVEQIVGVLKQAEVGVPVAELIRKAGISEQRRANIELRYACVMDNDDLDKMTGGQLDSEKKRCERRRADVAERLPKGFAAGERDSEALGELKRLALRIAKIDQVLAEKR